MELTQEFVEQLRRKLGEEVSFDTDEKPVLAAFDRALSWTLLADGSGAPTPTRKSPVAGSAAARARGRKAAAARKANREKGGENASSASNQESQG